MTFPMQVDISDIRHLDDQGQLLRPLRTVATAQSHHFSRLISRSAVWQRTSPFGSRTLPANKWHEPLIGLEQELVLEAGDLLVIPPGVT